MDIVVSLAMGYLLVLAIIATFGNPFFIGKERQPYSAGNYMLELSWATSVVVVAGRLFAWW